MKYWQRLDTPIMTVAIIAIVYAVFLHLQLSKHNYDFSAFVTAGDVYVDSNAAPANLSILHNSAGYDGQFYYRLALTPFTAARTDFGITLDMPAYRQQRIMYPLLARLLSLGQPALLPASMILVNFLALCLLAWFGARYAHLIHLHAIWGLVFALFPGFLLTLSRNTVEIVEISLLLAAVVYLRQQRHFLAGILLVLAVLARETALVLPLGMLVAIPFARWRRTFQDAWFPIMMPIVTYVLWQMWLEYTWSSASVTGATVNSNLGIPLLGLLRFVDSILPATAPLQRLWLIELLLIALFVLAVVLVFSHSAARPFIKLSWILSAALTFSLTQAVWVEDWAFLRVLSETYLFGVIILLESQSALKRWIFGQVAISWLLLATHVVNMR